MIDYQIENFGKSYDFKSRTHNGFAVQSHIHDFCELAFTKTGCQRICIDGREYSVKANQAALILPDQIHSYSDKEKAEMRCAVFSKDFVPLLFLKLGDKVLSNPIADFSENTTLLSCIEEVRPDELLKISGILTLICDVFLSSSELVSKGDTYGTLYYYVINYITENYNKEITLKKLSKELGYNEKYLSSAIHALTGTNFRTFLSSYRIEFAKRRLLSDKSNITDIAFDCGFGSANSFNRIFKAFTGVTPSQYRLANK